MSTADSFPPRCPQFNNRGGDDPTPFLKRFVSIKVFLGLGMLAGALLPNKIALPLSLAVLSMALLNKLGQRSGVLLNPRKKNLVRGRYTADMPDDFVVFLLGVRFNSAFPNETLKKMGEATEAMQKELEAKPEIGCFGSEQYIGATDGSDTLTIQYWKSAEHLENFAQSKLALLPMEVADEARQGI